MKIKFFERKSLHVSQGGSNLRGVAHFLYEYCPTLFDAWTYSRHFHGDSDWHVYGLELTPCKAKLFMDGNLAEEVHAGWLKDLKNMYMYIHLIIGDESGYTPNLNGFSYDIDYMRYWEFAASNFTQTYCTPALPPTTFYGQPEIELGEQNNCHATALPAGTWTFLPNKAATLWDGAEFNDSANNTVYIMDQGCR